MTITEWRTNPTLVEKTGSMLADPLFVEMMKVVEAASIVPPVLVGTSPDDKALILGQILGYRACIGVIRSMATPETQKQDIEPTYETPE